MTAEFFLSRFTPSMMSADVLEKVFVQRGDLADRIVEVVRESILTPSKHHTLVIGSRGIGKTHLLALIQNRIARQDVLADKVRIAWLREEEWGVASFLDFLYRILRALATRYDDEELQEQTEQLFSLPLKTAERRAADLLRAFVGDKTLLLIAENLDNVFTGLGKKGQQRLRAYLQEESSWTILASSQALFGGITLHDSPFYGFFDIHHLQELSVDDAARLVQNIAELAKDSELAAYVQSEAGRARIRAVHHLAGGNHRVYMILSEFLTRDSLDQLVEPFLRMMDDLTPYYQARMEQLSPQQRKIIDLLCSVRGAVPVKEIAKRCFISPQTASSQLKDLRDRGYVESTPVGRDAYYELAEPLMRLALEVKNHRNSHVRLFLDFLRHWYARSELMDLLARTPVDSVLEREYLQWVLHDSGESAETPQLQTLVDEISEFASGGMWEKALPVAEKLIQHRGSVYDWTTLGGCLVGTKRYTEALAALNRALELDDTDGYVWMGRAVTFMGLRQAEDALYSISRAIELQPEEAHAYGMQAVILGEMGHLEDAVAACDRALELAPDLAEAWKQRSKLLRRMKKYEEALVSIDHALSFEPNSVALEVERGFLLNWARRFEEAVEVFDSILAQDSENTQALAGLGLAHSVLNRDELALSSVTKAHALRPRDPLINWLLGRQLVKLGRYMPAIAVLDEAEQLGIGETLILESRVRALFGLNETEKGTRDLKRWLASVSEGKQLDQATLYLLADLFSKVVTPDVVRMQAAVFYSTYRETGFGGVLASGLVRIAGVLASPRVPADYAHDWVLLWRELTSADEKFALTLRLLDTVLHLRESGDARVLLQLPAEERRIVTEVLESIRTEPSTTPLRGSAQSFS